MIIHGLEFSPCNNGWWEGNFQTSEFMEKFTVIIKKEELNDVENLYIFNCLSIIFSFVEYKKLAEPFIEKEWGYWGEGYDGLSVNPTVHELLGSIDSMMAYIEPHWSKYGLSASFVLHCCVPWIVEYHGFDILACEGKLVEAGQDFSVLNCEAYTKLTLPENQNVQQ